MKHIFRIAGAPLLALSLLAGCATQPQTPASYSPIPAKAPAPPATPPPVPSAPAPRIRSSSLPKIAPEAMTSSATSQAQVFVSRKTNSPPRCTLAWDPSPNPSVVGYNLYMGTASRAYTNFTDAGSATSLSVSNLAFATTYYFAATCYTASGMESDYSAEANWATPSLPLPPGNFQFTATFADNIGGPWLQDTNWAPIVLSSPLGNQLWRLSITRVSP